MIVKIELSTSLWKPGQKKTKSDYVSSTHFNKQPAILILGLQLEGQRLIPHGVQSAADGLRFFLYIIRIRDQLHLDVGIGETVRIHRDQVAALFY